MVPTTFHKDEALDPTDTTISEQQWRQRDERVFERNFAPVRDNYDTLGWQELKESWCRVQVANRAHARLQAAEYERQAAVAQAAGVEHWAVDRLEDSIAMIAEADDTFFNLSGEHLTQVLRRHLVIQHLAGYVTEDNWPQILAYVQEQVHERRAARDRLRTD